MAVKIIGVTFDSLRMALTDLYFRTPDMDDEGFREALKYVVPMQHNFKNPIEPGAGDTYIQYWIVSDDRITRDFNLQNHNSTMKVAHCKIRFIGRRAETWAKSFHHLTQRKIGATVFAAYCSATMFDYIGPILIHNVDYFGTANATKAFTINFRLRYDEIIDFTDGKGGGDELEYLSFAQGIVLDRPTSGGVADG